MASERLSKLQKFILMEAYEAGERELIIERQTFGRFPYKRHKDKCLKCYYLKKFDIYRIFFECEFSTNSQRVILSNSLKRLVEKELIILLPYFNGKAKDRIILTDEGVEKARELNA